MKSIPPQCCASRKEVPSPSNAPTTHFPGSHIRWRCAFLSDPMDTEELLQEVFKKSGRMLPTMTCAVGSGNYDSPVAIKRATESPCFIAATAAIRRPDPWYWPLSFASPVRPLPLGPKWKPFPTLTEPCARKKCPEVGNSATGGEITKNRNKMISFHSSSSGTRERKKASPTTASTRCLPLPSFGVGPTSRMPHLRCDSGRANV